MNRYKNISGDPPEELPQAYPEAREKTERNNRIIARYDVLMRAGKHGHYETMCQVMHEEIARDREWRRQIEHPTATPPATPA